MKKYLILFTLPLLAILNSCQKIAGYQVGANTGVSATYQPLTSGSIWKYRTDYSAAVGYPYVDTSIITMSSKTLTISGKIYNQAFQSDPKGTYIDTGYYSASNHEYSTMEQVPVGTSTYAVEMLYLKDDVPVGTTWTGNLNYSTLGNVALNGKITEKGISKTVYGKAYSNVIHSSIQLSMSVFGTAMTFTYEIYAAPNVGIIHVDLVEPNSPTISEDLISATIK